MRKWKAILFSTVCIGVLMFAGICLYQKVVISGDDTEKEVIVIEGGLYPAYTFSEAIEEAVTIVYGRAVGKSATKAHQITYDDYSPLYEYYKEVSIEVIDILKGNMDAATVICLEFGGETEEAIYIEKSQEPIELGEEYILFLNKHGAAISPMALLKVNEDVVLTEGKLVPESDVSTFSTEVSVESYLNAIKAVLEE